MKHILSILLLLASIVCHAQNPGSHLGTTLDALKERFPELRYVETDARGDVYQDGQTQEGVSFTMHIKDNIVTEQCMVMQRDDMLPLTIFQTDADDFKKRFPSCCTLDEEYSKRYVFPSCIVTFEYSTKDGVNTYKMDYKAPQTLPASMVF